MCKLMHNNKETFSAMPNVQANCCLKLGFQNVVQQIERNQKYIAYAYLKLLLLHYSIDALKAFDKVNFVKLFSLLIDKNISVVFLSIIMDLYTRQNLRASWNGVISTPFSVPNDARQGGILSPTLFNVYIDERLLRLKQYGIGCRIGKKLWEDLVMLMTWQYHPYCARTAENGWYLSRTLQMIILLPKY